MTAEKIKSVLAMYRAKFATLGIERRWFPDCISPTYTSTLEHCADMLDDVGTFIDEGRLEKAFRWLGFIQGCLWATGTYTLEELKNHNKP